MAITLDIGFEIKKKILKILTITLGGSHVSKDKYLITSSLYGREFCREI